jgi:hypothetical protein
MSRYSESMAATYDTMPEEEPRHSPYGGKKNILVDLACGHCTYWDDGDTLFMGSSVYCEECGQWTYVTGAFYSNLAIAR